MRIRALAVVAWTLLACVGCAHRGESASGSGPTGPAQAALYYPLAVGNRWTYETNFLGAKRNQTVEIVREEGGYFFDNQGGQLAVDAYGVRDQKRYLLRDPVGPGTKWTNVVSVSTVEHYTVLEAGIRCDTPAGSFQGCIQVESRNRVDGKTTLINVFTMAPHVGIVRIEVSAEAGGKKIPQTSLVLKEYKVQPVAR